MDKGFGLSEEKNGASALQQVFVLQDGGTELAACPVNYGTAQKIEAWIRHHPSFRWNVPQNSPVAAPRAQPGLTCLVTPHARLSPPTVQHRAWSGRG